MSWFACCWAWWPFCLRSFQKTGTEFSCWWHPYSYVAEALHFSSSLSILMHVRCSTVAHYTYFVHLKTLKKIFKEAFNWHDDLAFFMTALLIVVWPTGVCLALIVTYWKHVNVSIFYLVSLQSFLLFHLFFCKPPCLPQHAVEFWDKNSLYK